MKTIGMTAVLALSIATGCAANEAEVAQSDANLIGGTRLEQGDLPSTLLIKGSCTAAKVGPRHILTAAHCVWDVPGAGSTSTASMDPRFVDGARIEVTTEARAASATYAPLTIKHTHVAPEWIENCALPMMNCGNVGHPGDHRPSDVALVETVEEIVDVATAAIDTEPMAPGESVIVSGYGCEGSVGGYWSSSLSKLKAGVVQLLPATSLLHSGSPVTDAALPVVENHDLLTPGPAWPTPGPGLCPGDSGGPLYRVNGGGATIVGVNASYTFSGSGGLPVTNWHARLDHLAGRDIAGWLGGLGATTCSGDTCPTRTIAGPIATPAPTPALTSDLASNGRDASCQRAVFDVSKVQIAIEEVLPVSASCMPLQGTRVSAGESYAYRALAYCWTNAGVTLTEEQTAGFPAAMAAKGFEGFAVAGSAFQGYVRSKPCDTYPTGEAGCKASLAPLERVAVDVKRATGQKARCEVIVEKNTGAFFYQYIACELENPLTPQYQTYFETGLKSLRYTTPRYDEAAKTVSFVSWSIPCAVFGSGAE